MSYEAMDKARNATTEAILAKVGKVFDKAEQMAGGVTNEAWRKRVMAGRIALEYAVLATAREKGVATEMVADALTASSLAQQAKMIKDGTTALGKAYELEPNVLVNVFAGKLVDINLPKGFASSPEIDKMVDSCRTLVTTIVKEEYANRGRFEPGGDRKDSFIALKSDGLVSGTKSELAARIAFLESNIDAGVEKGVMSKEDAGMLKERIEAQVFQPRPPQSLQFSKEFLAFYESRGAAIRTDAMKQVRSVTQSSTVQDIGVKLREVIAQNKVKPSEQSIKGIERGG